MAVVSQVKVKEEGSPDVAQFINKVWKIVDSSYTDHLIRWTEDGKTFIINDETTFAKDILPHYFKHNNFASFVRQLNLYGFRKVAKPDQGALFKTKDYSIEFWHTNFRRDHPDLLHLVQRRPVATNRGGADDKTSHLSQLITEIHQMKGHHESTDTMLNDLKRENSHLKQEIVILREKQKHQQKLLNKIIHFIVHILYKGNLLTKRNQLMLTDGEDDTLAAAAMLPLKRPKLDAAPLLYDVESPPPSAPLYSPPVSAGASMITLPPSSNINGLSDPSQFAVAPLASGDDLLAQLLTETSPTGPVSQPSSQSIVPSSQSSIVPSSQSIVPASQSIVPLSQTLVPTSLPATNPVPALLPYAEPPPGDSNDPCCLDTLNCRLENQEQSLQTLHNVLPEQLNIDPSIMSEFFTNTDFMLPEYDFLDTARLLESMSGESEDAPHDNTAAVVPFTAQDNQFTELLQSFNSDTNK